jgi:UDP-N-acetylmuramate dehydrogenase
VRWAADRRLPLFVLGGGSNVVIGDAGFDGLVLHVALRGLAFAAGDDGADVHAAAGEPWDELVAAAVERAAPGVLSGIPASSALLHPERGRVRPGRGGDHHARHGARHRSGETVAFTSEEAASAIATAASSARTARAT